MITIMTFKPWLASGRAGANPVAMSSSPLGLESFIMRKFVLEEFQPIKAVREVLKNLKETLK